MIDGILVSSDVLAAAVPWLSTKSQLYPKPVAGPSPWPSEMTFGGHPHGPEREPSFGFKGVDFPPLLEPEASTQSRKANKAGGDTLNPKP